jgi:hypothetical protein
MLSADSFQCVSPNETALPALISQNVLASKHGRTDCFKAHDGAALAFWAIVDDGK